MRLNPIRHGLFAAIAIGVASMPAAENVDAQPVTPNASAEAVELLNYLHSVSGRHTLAGQHCVPLVGSTRLVVAYRATERYPAVFGQDFGFDAPGSWDGINYRQRIVDEAIRRHGEGFIITLMWHAVRPTEEEPVTFGKSIQGKLTDDEWEELLTPGSRLNERWQSQVDVIAWHLKQLRNARVPVLWRPYHEMNGDWFWWGGRTGDEGYRKLYRMMYDRFTEFHGLNNLLWVFNGNELNDDVAPYESCYPGADVVDILATDVYRRGFATEDYENLLALAGGKPIALGEVGSAPTPELLQEQPRWTWFMLWGDPGGWHREGPSLRSIYESEEVLTLEQLPWVNIGTPALHAPILK